MNYILANPLLSYGEVAGAFGVTPAWLSTIVHSHAFQDRLKRRQDQVFDSTVLADLGDKITAAAHMTMDEYMNKVPTLTADQLISSSDKLLSKLGYGSKGNGAGPTINAGVVNIQHNHVPKDVLAEARGRIGANGNNQLGEGYRVTALLHQTTLERTETQGVVIRAEGA